MAAKGSSASEYALAQQRQRRSIKILGPLLVIVGLLLIGLLVREKKATAESAAQDCIKKQRLDACETAKDLQDYLDVSTRAKLDKARRKALEEEEGCHSA